MVTKEVQASEITKTIRRLCIEANTLLEEDVIAAYEKGLEIEESLVGKTMSNEDVLSLMRLSIFEFWIYFKLYF